MAWTSRSTASSNADLVATLLNEGALRSETIAEAMTTDDRKLFFRGKLKIEHIATSRCGMASFTYRRPTYIARFSRRSI